MIYGELKGRCGHQLLIYAAARALQLMFYPEDTLCFNEYQIKQKQWNNELVHFNIAKSQFISSARPVLKAFGVPSQKAAMKWYSARMRFPKMKTPDAFYGREERFGPALGRAGVYALAHAFVPFESSTATDKFVDGIFEDPRYFDDVRETLLHEIVPLAPPSAKNKALYDIIQNRQSVCVTIRRGEFFDPQYQLQSRRICQYDYFKTAIEIVKQAHPDAVFVFFSDEIDWIRDNYHFDAECYYEDGTDTIGEKLRLMSSCKHFIISNSSFSWWAQYLGQDEDKLVVAPSRWNTRAHYRYPQKQPTWIIVDT